MPTDSHISQPPPPTSCGSDELKLNSAVFRVDHHLLGYLLTWILGVASKQLRLLHGRVGGLGIYKSIPVSDTKLTLGLRVDFISSHLSADKLFPVNSRGITGLPKMSLLLGAKSMPALIIKPRLILAAHRDDLGWNKTSNQE